ncbi:MAG: DUF4238 domain-containing protein [Pseudomonadota bacterium]|nr:DUF4238 domain-containing protein [Pseudomonadota bacterium]
MAAPELTKRNHYIPASIVGAFSDEPKSRMRDSVVYWAMKGWPQPKPSKVEKLFCLDDIYTLPAMQEPWKVGLLIYMWHVCVGVEKVPPVELIEEDLIGTLALLATGFSKDGELRPDVVEGMLATELDAPFNDVATRLREGLPPSEPDLELCRAFLSLLYFRGPAWKHSSTCAQMVRHGLARERARFEASGRFDPASWSDPVVVAMQEILPEISYMLDLGERTRKRVNLLTRRHFAIELLRAGPGIGFVIGDNAARAYSAYEDPSRLTPSAKGIRNPGVVIVFPIGQKHALRVVQRDNGPRFQRLDVSDVEVRGINTAQLTMAAQKVVFPGRLTDVFVHGASVEASTPWIEL